MMGPLWVTLALLATQVTCSLAACDLSSPLNSTEASELLRNYTEQIRSNAVGNTSFSGVTVLQLVEFALNTTGNTTLTKSKLNWNDTCLDAFKFTLSQVAMINGKELDNFPGNATMDDVRVLLTSNATKSVVQDVGHVLSTLRHRNVSLDRNLDFFIQDVGFVIGKSSFLSMLSYSLKSSDRKSTASLLGYDIRLENATLGQVAEYLLLTPEELQKNLTLEYVVRYLRSARTFFHMLLGFVKEERDRWAEKTVWHLVNSTEDTTILTTLKGIYQGNNLTFIQFIWERRVELRYMNYTVAELAASTAVQSAVIKNYTILETFEFLYKYTELNLVYKESIAASRSIREKILRHYQLANMTILEDTFNVTTSYLHRLTDFEFENYAIKYYIQRYAKVHLNITFGKLEAFAKLDPGSLNNASVEDFPQLMSRIGVAYAIKALNESGFLKYLLNNHSALEIHMLPLKQQIEKDRQPLTKNYRVLFHEFKVSYLIYLYRLDTTVFYKRTVFNFTETLKLNWHTFLLLFDLDNKSLNEAKGLFMTYSFKELSIFFGIKEYTIFNWNFLDIINRLLYLNRNSIDECSLGGHSCARRSQCNNYAIGGYTCACPADINVDPDNYCRDVNECKLVEPKNGGCSNHSHCVNTYGSFVCVCDQGYRKNLAGECVDINECSTIFNKCIPQAVCENLPGSYKCICHQGFYFDRLNYCKDINECLMENSCSNVNNSVCNNKRGSYECRCNIGFNANYDETVSPKVLLSCTDIDECSRANGCHKNADCNNTIGSYKCKCKKDYVGDGYSCKENRVIDPTLIQGRLISFTRTVELRPLLGFYYGGKSHSKIYISNNGLISLGKYYTRSTPKSCKNGRLKKDIIAPFWASARGGRVGYQQFAKEEEEAGPVLERINEIINQTTNLAGFEANWALVVSWANRTPQYCFWRFCWNRYKDETNTFQAVMATNGSTSVVMFLYDDNGMNWYRRLRRKAMVGYATMSGGCKEYEGSFTESIFDIGDESYIDPAGKKRKGVLVIVFSKGNAPPTPEEKCLSWIRKQPKDNEWINEIPSCPCSLRAVQIDSRFESWSGALTNRRICYAYIKEEYTKTCCYFRRGFWTTGALITSALLAGRVARYSPVSNKDSYRQHDEEPFQTCCIDSNKYCNDFSQYRPIEDSCSNQRPPPCSCRWKFGFRGRWRRTRIRRRVRRGWFFGDPHIATLDGFKYSFNGLGDYILLTTTDKSHILHGKTIRPPYKDTNRLSNATVFSGFAMKNKKNTTVQVLFSDTMPGNLSILVYNSTNVCGQTFGIDALKKATGFLLKKSNDTLIVLFEDSGFSVEITPGIGLLQIGFSVPPELEDKNTTGLLGILNGNKTDDLTYPNGTAISTESTDKEIFAFGQTWKVPDDEGLFVFAENCSKKPVYFDGSFRPTFLSDYNMSAIDPNITKMCNNNKQCILDILLTGNEALGLASADFDKKNDKKKAAMDNQPPDIIVTPNVINVTVNERVNITVNANDPNDGDTFTLSDTGELPAGASFDNITGIFSWLPSSVQREGNFKIEFAAVDKQGASQVKSVEVKFCDCKNGQECDFTNILTSNQNNSFELVGCNCSERYSGDDCGVVDDPCENSPCYSNVTCNSKPAPEFGYVCGACPDGLVGNGEDCNDFDECADPANNTCTVNETCINKVGSYECQCKAGYSKQTMGSNCTDVDECTNLNIGNDCKANSDCTNTLGGYNCTCKKGYEGNPKQGCTDIDECMQDGRCNHNCQDTDGSFNCTCFPGYKRNETSPGFYDCVDIDECKYSINNDCKQICQNTPSSYLCSCEEGYKLDSNNKTCFAKQTCNGFGCEHECVVINGTNECKCFKGYKLAADNKKCQDIDECSTNNGGCAHNCNNAQGNYSCSCKPGFMLMSNKRDCEDIDECKTADGGCLHMCTNTAGSRICSCKRGYKLDDDKMTCKDIDECKEGPGCRAKGQICKNKKGGYKCRCPPRKFSDGTFECKKSKRFKLKIRLLRYSNSPEFKWRSGLNDEFSDDYKSTTNMIIFNLNVFFRTKYRFRMFYLGCSVTGLQDGSIIANTTLNFDPNSNVTITGLNQDIKGVNGVMGALTFDPQSSSVSDVNECNDPEANDCDSHATCTNTDGSFSCSCSDGYSGDGVNCAKVKEDSNKTALIVGICIGVSLLIIIIIILILCCYKRKQKGDLRVNEEDYGHGMKPVQMKNDPPMRKSGGVYYGNGDEGRRGSDDSIEGQYDIAMGASSYYDNPVDDSVEGQYDVARAQSNYYDNLAVKKDKESPM